MSTLSEAFLNKKALITYITAGDPSLAATEKLVYGLVRAGADVIELGVPFSDPLADGPVIQASHQRALKKRVGLADVFKLVAKLRKKVRQPICLMPAYNLIVQYGLVKFYHDCEKFGVDGVIIPDLPPEEAPEITTSVDQVYLVAPTSTEERIKLITERSSGFVYLVSVAGITGARKGLSADLGDLVNRVRQYTKLPIAVGFGISTPAQAKEVSRLADGVIVGSALVDLVGKKKSAAAVKLAASLRKAIDKK